MKINEVFDSTLTDTSSSTYIKYSTDITSSVSMAYIYMLSMSIKYKLSVKINIFFRLTVFTEVHFLLHTKLVLQKSFGSGKTVYLLISRLTIMLLTE